MEIQLPQLIEEPPKFTSPLRDLTVNDGDRNVELKTQFRGNPKPAITWFFNSKPIQPNQDFKVHVDVQKGETSLVIIEVFPEDEGEYMVKAENRLGAAVTHCKMFVRCKYNSYYLFLLMRLVLQCQSPNYRYFLIANIVFYYADEGASNVRKPTLKP
jgi:hypothetical protein